MSSDSALRPVRLPSVPTNWSRILQLREELVRLNKQIADLDAGQAKIGERTVWRALQSSDNGTPGGQGSSLAPTVVPSKSASDNEDLVDSRIRAGQISPSHPAAKDSLATNRITLTRKVEAIEIQLKEEEALATKEKSLYPAMEDGWVLNENGEVLNEEGLPMFDIQEEVPGSSTDECTPIPSTSNSPPAQKPRYIIKSKGKAVAHPRPLKVPSVPASSSFPSVIAAHQALPPSAYEDPAYPAPRPDPDFDAKAFLDQLEREEEEAAVLRQAEEVDLGSPEVPSSAVLTSVVAPHIHPSSKPSVSNTGKKKDEGFLSGFGAGFLDKGSKGKSKVQQRSQSGSLPVDLPAPIKAQVMASHEPLHHTLPAPKSIYRPTPPSSTPGSRSGSPRPGSRQADRKVAFNVEAGEQPGEVEVEKPKKRAIPLPPPPTTEEAQKQKEKLSPFKTAFRQAIVERPMKGVTAPEQAPVKKARQQERPRDPNATVGLPPKPARITGSVVEQPLPANSSATRSREPEPIHTISFSSKTPTSDGVASVHDVLDVHGEEDEHPSIEPEVDDDDEDSSDFYTYDDESDTSEIDIDEILHAREVTMEYHRQRMGLGAGAGTGPLGGDRPVEEWDSWNQPEVPLDATMQGRPHVAGGRSRFKTGRLESAQLIIPSVLASQIRKDIGSASDSEGEDDGLTPDEREQLRRTLERLSLGLPPEEVEQTPSSGPTKATSSISQVLNPQIPVESKKAPPEVKSSSMPIASASVIERFPPSAPPLTNASTPSSDPKSTAAATEDPPKRVSRFKAKQMGLV